MWRKWRRKLKCYLILFLRLNGNSRKIALGYALGACINFYPTFGFGLPIAGGVAAIFRANVYAGLLGDIMFKLFWPIFFVINVKVGRLFISSEATPYLDFHHLKPKSFLLIGKVFMTGALINTFVLGSALFFLVYIIFNKYRVKLLSLVVNWQVGGK